MLQRRVGGGRKVKSSLTEFLLYRISHSRGDQYKMTMRKCTSGGQTMQMDKTKVHLIKTTLQINQTLCTYLLRGINQHWIDYSE